jgi:ribulose bisphosphate carboxylase small subunit
MPEMSEKEAFSIDRVQQDKAKEILLVLENAVSAARLFPSEHQTIRNFISDLYQRLSEYLENYLKLEIGIEEQAFTLDGKTIHQDPNPARSLPFFFFKDGMKMLEFHRGLQKSELEGLLDAIREVSQLPPEESDIVNALWELDFPNIRHVAPDDFLETKIGVGRKLLRPEVNVDSLGQGRVELTPEDLEEIRKNTLALVKSKENEKAAAGPSLSEEIGITLAKTDDRESEEIEALLTANRRLSHEEEYLSLILEIIYLEDRPEQFPAIADILEQYHQDAIQKGEFRRAAKLLRALSEIKDLYATKNKLKSDLMASVIALLGRKSYLVELRDSLDPGSISDAKGLFDYLRFFGSRSARLVADVYERTTNQDWRLKALEILKEIGKSDLNELMALVQESRPALSQEIIRILGESEDLRIVTFLANIVAYKNTPVKLAAIRALGRIQDEAVNKVLLGFLADPNEEVRVTALDNIKKAADRQVLSHVIEAISDKDFLKKSIREKKSLFDVLGRSDCEESCSFLGAILTHVPFLPNSKHTELCLYSISALEQMRLSTSREILKKGAKRRHLKIRNACLKAIQSKSEIAITYTGRTVR